MFSRFYSVLVWLNGVCGFMSTSGMTSMFMFKSVVSFVVALHCILESYVLIFRQGPKFGKAIVSMQLTLSHFKTVQSMTAYSFSIYRTGYNINMYVCHQTTTPNETDCIRMNLHLRSWVGC